MAYELEKQHKKNKLHAIERIHKIVDPLSFNELWSQANCTVNTEEMRNVNVPYDGVITGYGTVSGKKVFIYSQDFTVMGGSLGKQHGIKISNCIKLAIKNKCPIIGINDSGGARIQEGVHSLTGYGEIFYNNTLASGYIPQISVIAGPCAGGAVYSPGITDFVFVIDNVSNMFVTGPKVIKSVTRQDVTPEQLGGSGMHSQKSGVAHFRYETEDLCYENVRKLIDYIPQYYGDESHFPKLPEYAEKQKGILSSLFSGGKNKEKETDKKPSRIDSILPKNSSLTYDMKDIIKELFDSNTFFEVQAQFAQNIVVGFAKMKDCVVGIVANQPKHLAGVLDCDASDKAARFIRYCDSFNIPIITLADVPGFMPSIEQEEKGIIRHGAKLLYAYSEATTAKISIVLRKAYGGAYIAMCSKYLGADFTYAWDTAEIAVMGADAAVEVLYSKDIANSADRQSFVKEKIQAYKECYVNPRIAVESGYIDEILLPSETRDRLFSDLMLLKDKKEFQLVNKKHGNIPL